MAYILRRSKNDWSQGKGVMISKSRAENQGALIPGSRPGPTLLTIHAPKQKDLVTEVCWSLGNAPEQGLLHAFRFLCLEFYYHNGITMTTISIPIKQRPSV